MSKVRLKFALGVPALIVSLLLLSFFLIYSVRSIPFLVILIEKQLIKGVSYSSGNCGGDAVIECVSFSELQKQREENQTYIRDYQNNDLFGCAVRKRYIVCDSFRGKIYRSIYPITKKLHPSIDY